jgi:hypothetical protein
MEHVHVNYPEILAKITGTSAGDWDEVAGPSTGCGSEYWYRHGPEGLLAYINLDQEVLNVDVSCADDVSKDTGFQGSLSDFAEFVTRQGEPRS